jgi:drug/metabolite transporter (DMT)-like permease
MMKWLPAAAATANGILVGAAMVATRFVIDQSEPASLALLRYAIGFLCLTPPVLLSRRVRFERHDLLPIALLGIAQFGILIVLLNYGLKTVPAARAALIFASFPLMTLVLSAALGRERLTLAKAAGVLLTMVGVGLALAEKAVGEKALAGAATDGWIGELAILASALTGAVCSVLYRPYLARYAALHVSAFAMIASVIFLLVPAAGEGFFSAWPGFTWGGWLAVAFIGMASGLGYFLWLWALTRATPTRVTVFLSLSPVTAAFLGAMLLGEPWSPVFLAAVASLALGLWLAHRPERAVPQ